MYWGGHHETYLKLYTKTFLELGNRVIIFCPEKDKLREWLIKNCLAFNRNFLTFNIKDLQFKIFRGRFKALTRWTYTSYILRKIFNKYKINPDLIFFLWLDSYLFSINNSLLKSFLFRVIEKILPYNWSGLYFHPMHLRLFSNDSKHKNDDCILNISNCTSVAILDKGLLSKLSDRLNSKPVFFLPDITDESEPEKDYIIVKDIKSKANGRKIIGLLGALHKRKGIMTLVKVSQLLKEENYFFAFVGKLNEISFQQEELDFLYRVSKEENSNCYFYFNSIPDEAKFNALVEICDIVFASYIDFPHSSNLITKAAIFEKPLIVSKGFYMEEVAENYKIGISIEQENVKECVDAIEYIVKDISFYKENFEKYRKLNFIEELNKSLQKLLFNIKE